MSISRSAWIIIALIVLVLILFYLVGQTLEKG
jgi:hypothetical protein